MAPRKMDERKEEMLIRDTNNNNNHKSRINARMLAGFYPLSGLDEDELFVLEANARIQEVAKKHCLFTCGSSDEWAYYLLEGRVRLTAADGSQLMLEGGSEAARNPLSNLQPRKYTATTLSAAKLLVIRNDLLSGIVSGGEGDHAYSVQEIAPLDACRDDKLFYEILHELAERRLGLPTLPDVASQLSVMLEDEAIDIEEMVRLIKTDPAIAAKLVKVANSALYQIQKPVGSCKEAILRIGLDITRLLVMRLAMSDLFTCRRTHYQARMEALWQHSVEIAAISNVLAHLTTGLNPEKAFLIGLLHDVGAQVVLSYANKYPNRLPEPEDLERAIQCLRARIGEEVMKMWRFGTDYIDAAREAECWERDPAPQPDYCDVVVAAQLHSFIGRPAMLQAPNFYEVAAFGKLAGGHLTPELSITILKKAREQITLTQQLLASA